MRNIIDINDDKYNYRNLYFIIVIIGFVMMIVGATYAYVTKSINFDNSIYNTVTTCFNVDYSYSNDGTTDNTGITGILFPSSSHDGGLSGKVSLNIKNNCKVSGRGKLFLNVASVHSTLIKKVTEHCENFRTLETLLEYDSLGCNGDLGLNWVVDGTALKYAVYEQTDSGKELLNVGYITNTGKITILEDFIVTNKSNVFDVYIWLDGYIVDNDYAGLEESFNGNINISVEQIEELIPTYES